MVLGGEGGGCEGGGGRVMPIAVREGREGRPGGRVMSNGVRRCGVDACARRSLLLTVPRPSCESCESCEYGDSGEVGPVREEVDRLSE